MGDAPLKRTAAATQRYAEAHRAFVGNGGAAAPKWLKDLRQRGIGRLVERGFPTTALEEWRFTNVAPIVEGGFTLPHVTGGARVAGDPASHLFPAVGGQAAVFVDGRFVPEWSSLAGLPQGVAITGLAEAVARDPDLVRRHLGGSEADAANAFAALNTAFLADGAFVHVRAGAEGAEPLQVLFLTSSDTGLRVTHPRLLVVVERAARLTLVELYAGPAEAVYWTNAVTEVVAGDGARVDVYRVQREGERAYHVASTHVRQGRDSAVNVHAVVLGAALARHDLTAVLDGEGASCLLNGLYVAGGVQHVDHHTVIDHVTPHAESHEYFNGVLADRARGVFNGRIVVRPGAQRTIAKQTNHNLLLSEEARADSQPQLEIHADDVKCTHGATLGPLDEKALFYLESRGLGAAEARSMLTYGFGAEILHRMEAPRLRTQLEALVRARLQGGPRA